MVNQQRTSEGPGIKVDDRKRHKAPDLFQERTTFFLFFTAAHILFFSSFQGQHCKQNLNKQCLLAPYRGLPFSTLWPLHPLLSWRAFLQGFLLCLQFSLVTGSYLAQSWKLKKQVMVICIPITFTWSSLPDSSLLNFSV